MNLFGKKKAAPTTSLPDAIKKLKDAVVRLINSNINSNIGI